MKTQFQIFHLFKSIRYAPEKVRPRLRFHRHPVPLFVSVREASAQTPLTGRFFGAKPVLAPNVLGSFVLP